MNPDSNLAADRFELLDRLAARVPELDLDEHRLDWITLPDGAGALSIDGGGLDGGNGIHFVNYRDDLHAYGSLAPMAPVVGCIVIAPDGTRTLVKTEPDPLAQEPDS